jgi:hypothetical protein
MQDSGTLEHSTCIPTSDFLFVSNLQAARAAPKPPLLFILRQQTRQAG